MIISTMAPSLVTHAEPSSGKIFRKASDTFHVCHISCIQLPLVNFTCLYLILCYLPLFDLTLLKLPFLVFFLPFSAFSCLFLPLLPLTSFPCLYLLLSIRRSLNLSIKIQEMCKIPLFFQARRWRSRHISMLLRSKL